VFRSFSEEEAAQGKTLYRFQWLWNAPFRLSFDTRTGAIVFEDLAKIASAGPELEASVRIFVAEYQAVRRPAHRRIDPARLRVTVSKRNGVLSLRFKPKDGDYGYAVNRAVNLVNELFTSHLSLQQPEFLARQFRLPEE
jgi:hypothetical protein